MKQYAQHRLARRANTRICVKSDRLQSEKLCNMPQQSKGLMNAWRAVINQLNLLLTIIELL